MTEMAFPAIISSHSMEQYSTKNARAGTPDWRRLYCCSSQIPSTAPSEETRRVKETFFCGLHVHSPHVEMFVTQQNPTESAGISANPQGIESPVTLTIKVDNSSLLSSLVRSICGAE